MQHKLKTYVTKSCDEKFNKFMKLKYIFWEIRIVFIIWTCNLQLVYINSNKKILGGTIMANVLDELLERGYIKQFTHEEETRNYWRMKK